MKKLLLTYLLLAAGFLTAQTAEFTASPQTICVGGNVQFTDASTGATSWSWTFIDGGSGQTSSLQSPIITYSIAGVYTVILTVTNGISSDTEIKSGYVTVVNNASLTLISSVGSDNQTICENTPLAPTIKYDLIGATGAVVSGLPPGVSDSFTPSAMGGTVSIFGTPNVPGTYNYTVTSTGGNCAPVSAIGTITVEAAATITFVSAAGTDNQTVCLNSPIISIDYVFGGSATGTTTTGLPPGISSSTAGNMTSLTGTVSTAGSFPYSISTTGSTCPSVTLNGLISVDALPGLALNSAAGTDNQTICENTAISTISIGFSGSATGASVSGLPTGVSGTVSASNFLITGTPTVPGTYPFTVTSIGGSCPSVTFSGSITVSPSPTIILTSMAGTNNQTVCESTAITAITYSIGGSATGAAASGLPAGLTENFSAGIFTISGTPIVSGSFNYTVTTTGGVCSPVTASGTIQVDALPVISLSSAPGTDNQNVCENTAITTIQYTLGGSAAGITASGLPAGVSTTVVGNIVTINGSPALVGTFSYTLTTTGGTCIPVTISGTIISDPAPTITLISAVGTDGQIVCQNTGITPIDYIVGGSATGASVSGLPAGVTGTFAAGILSITGNPTVSGLYNYTVTTSGGVCTAVTANGTVQVDSLPAIVLSSVAGSDNQTVCQNTAVTTIEYSIAGSASGVTSTGLPAGISVSVAGNIVTLSGSPTIAGTFNYTLTTTGGTCTAVSISGTIISDQAPTIALTSAVGTDNQTVCQNTPMTTLTYNVGGSSTSAVVTTLPAGLTGGFAAGTFTISGTPTIAGTYPFTVTSSGGACLPISLSGSIIVQSPEITLTSTTYTNDQVICLGNALSTISYNVGTTVAVNDLPAGVISTYTAGSPNTLTISGTPTTVGAFYYTISATGGCGNNLVVGNIEILAPISGNTSGNNTTICEGNTFNLTGGTLANSGSPYIFEWQASVLAAGPYVPAPGINNASNYSGQVDFSDSLLYYRRVVSNATCSDTAAFVQISLDSLPAILSSGSGTMCSSDSLILAGIALSAGNISSWSYPGTGQILNPLSAAPTFVAGQGETGSTLQLHYFVSSSNSCAPDSVEGIYPITVLANPTANLSGTATVCANGTSVAINGASITNGSFAWLHNGNGLLSDTATLTPSYYTDLTDTNSIITIELVASSGAACTNSITDTASFIIQVLPYGINPAVNAFAGSNDTISIGNGVQLSGNGTAIVSWIWSPSAGLSDSTVSNPFANPSQTTDYVLSVTDINGCMDSDTLTVFVETDYAVFIPNLFSPNGDGYNDTWEIPEIANYPNTAVQIINREGQVVYSNENYDNTWDGTHKEKDLPEATYYYLIVFENSDVSYKGAVTILRSKK